MTIDELKAKIDQLEGEQWNLQLQDKWDCKEYDEIHKELTACREELRRLNEGTTC